MRTDQSIDVSYGTKRAGLRIAKGQSKISHFVDEMRECCMPRVFQEQGHPGHDRSRPDDSWDSFPLIQGPQPSDCAANYIFHE